MNKLSDNEIVKRYLEGEEAALEVLIKRYLKPIYSFVYKNIGDGEAAEDITQEVFVKMWKNLKRHALSPAKGFDPKKGKFSAWIFTIAKNGSIDFLRRKKTVPLSFVEEFLVGKNNILETIEQKDILEAYKVVLKKLSPKHQALVLLRQQSGLSFREIAQSLGEPLNTVKSRYRRAAIALKKLVRDYG